MADGSALTARREPEFRVGRWSLVYLPPEVTPGRWKFQHDDFDGTPDLLDPRQGIAWSLGDCLARIAEMEVKGFDYD